jgi:nondiscriminating glutamyl-tRNA synthetase
LKQEGYLAEAVLNAASRLGWSPGAGFLGLEEMVKGFKPERVKKSPSVFDMERLKGFNKEALTRVDTERLVTVVGPHLEGVDRGWLAAAVRAVKGNCTTVNDIPELLAPFVEYELTDEAKSFLSEPHAPGLLKALLEEVENVERLDGAVYRDVIERLKKRTGETGKRLLMPVRAAITGRTTGVELEKVFTLLGKEKILERLKSCLK